MRANDPIRRGSLSFENIFCNFFTFFDPHGQADSLGSIPWVIPYHEEEEEEEGEEEDPTYTPMYPMYPHVPWAPTADPPNFKYIHIRPL